MHRLVPWFFDWQGHYIHGLKRWRQRRKAKPAERRASKTERAALTMPAEETGTEGGGEG
jgi:hypothetical protein